MCDQVDVVVTHVDNFETFRACENSLVPVADVISTKVDDL